MTDERSNILVYKTGHGGDEFLKFQDAEEISAFDLADAFQTMYNELLFMIDTCQANTMTTKLYSPNIIATGSSAKGENSYSHHADSDIGVAVVDRFSHFVLSHLEGLNKTSKSTFQDFVKEFLSDIFHSTPAARTDLLNKTINEVLMTDFFGGVSSVELYPIPLTTTTIQAGKDKLNDLKPEAIWKLSTSKWKRISSIKHGSFNTTSQSWVLDYWPQISSTFLLGFTLLAHFWAAHST
ncbi:hypothetical protein PSHT_08416 [Puccinia striiformis]|uniref:GPI-anchor transamidase n=1 Tax=Puccinia striiformis TaxID=27350 RepID=A0A2S4VQ46_9BASI|nr:hypothetical protein PSHT_08416 [Puccinia striiformis]